MSAATALLLCLTIRGAPPPGSSSQVDLRALAAAWSRFSAAPSEETALQVQRLLPLSKKAQWLQDLPKEEERKLSSSIYDHLEPLENAVAVGHRWALELTWRLFVISDGRFTQDLCAAIGSVIRPNPRLFLEKLSAHKELAVDLLDCILGYPYWMFDDEMGKQCEEFSERLKALRGVDEPALRFVRNQCEAILENRLKEDCERPPPGPTLTFFVYIDQPKYPLEGASVVRIGPAGSSVIGKTNKDGEFTVSKAALRESGAFALLFCFDGSSTDCSAVRLDSGDVLRFDELSVDRPQPKVINRIRISGAER